jgi:hypothetical protein
MELRRCHGCQEGAPSIGGGREALEGKECSALDELRAMGPKEEGAMGVEEAPCARLCGMRSAGRGGRLEHRELRTPWRLAEQRHRSTTEGASQRREKVRPWLLLPLRKGGQGWTPWAGARLQGGCSPWREGAGEGGATAVRGRKQGEERMAAENF